MRIFGYQKVAPNLCYNLSLVTGTLTFKLAAAAAAKLLQLCLTLCRSIDGSPPGSPFLGFSRQEYWSELPFPSLLLLLLSCFSHVRFCATPETAAHQALPSLGFSRQEHWSGFPFPSPVHESEKSK